MATETTAGSHQFEPNSMVGAPDQQDGGMTGKTVTIEVNGKVLQAPADALLIEVTDQADITVPCFCYHKKLPVVANCRMCLVDVETSDELLPACATPVSDGMKVWTRSKKARAAQQDIIERLLLNHPLDCPICDQGGECELQDVSMGFGRRHSPFAGIKRVVKDKDIGPLIETAMTRCIQCTRCVRFGEEMAGLHEPGTIGRGETVDISSYIAGMVTSELSGNVIDLCPVGALTAKPSRYRARPWEMRAHASIASHDSVGSNLDVHTFDGEVVRVVPRENEAINECWLADRDRFSYQGLYSHDRLLQPQIKQNGQWQPVSWQVALDRVAGILRAADPERTGGLIAPTSTLEELYLFGRLLRGAGFRHIDHRLRQLDFSDQAAVSAAPLLGVSIAELEQQQMVLLVGSDVRHEQPLLNLRLRKAVTNGGKVMALNPRRVAFNYPVEQTVVAPLAVVTALAAITRAMAEQVGKNIPDELADLCEAVAVTDEARVTADRLLDANRALILIGNMAMQHPQLSALRALLSVLVAWSGAKGGYLAEAANTVGAALAGVLPHRLPGGVAAAECGLTVADMLSAKLETLVLMNLESDDFANPYQAAAAFNQAQQVIAITPFASEQMREAATILLPGSTFAETSGTFINTAGSWQSFNAVTAAPGEARPGWKILRVLGNKLAVPEFDYLSAAEVASELKLELQRVRTGNRYTLSEKIVLPDTEERMQRIGDVQMYRSDLLVRRATALQAMIPEPLLHLSPEDMERLDYEEGELIKAVQGGGSVQLPVTADASVPPGCVWIQSGTTAANTLGDAFGYIDLDRV